MNVVPDGKMLTLSVFVQSMGLFNCITNIIIMLIPLHTIWTLNKVSVSTRMGLTGVFLLGLM